MRSRRSRRRSIDKEAGLLRLTTVLAHSSGEWISSEWPVCQISDIASAQRMGAALTYARRYALFTLVGIAGEDDLDAPDLGAAPKPAAELPRPGSQSNGQATAGKRTAPSDGKLPEPSARSVLGVQLSASLRESLIEQMAAINSADEAAAWAHRNLPAKNTLTAADAKIVEEQFRQGSLRSTPHMVLVTVRPRVMSRRMLSRTKPGCQRVDADTRRKHRWGPPKSNLAAMQSVLGEKRFACAIRITGASCCDRRASCAAACRGSASSHLYTTACTRAPCERRIHRPSLPNPSSRATSLW